jgi:KUP system potassium uptake protein
VVFIIASTWRAGRRRVAQVQLEQSQRVEDFLADIHGRPVRSHQGTAVFLTADPEGIPFVLCHHWARNHGIGETIVLLTLIPTTYPYVESDDHVSVEWLSPALVRVTARFGFMERIDIERIVNGCGRHGFELSGDDITYYSADPQIVPRSSGVFHAWRRGLYVILRRNARTITSTLGISADALAKLGIEVPM